VHHVRRGECRTGSNAAVNTTTDNAGARRSNSTTGAASTSGADHADESNGASGNTANKSDRTAGQYRDPASNAIAYYTGRHRARGIDHTKWIE